MASIARCSRGALFETKWVPFMSFTSVRLGRRRFQRCPVHHRWEMVDRVDPASLTDEERADAARYPAGRLP
jgi:hypothetical protein